MIKKIKEYYYLLKLIIPTMLQYMIDSVFGDIN